jgi:hypothetical protein
LTGIVREPYHHEEKHRVDKSIQQKEIRDKSQGKNSDENKFAHPHLSDKNKVLEDQKEDDWHQDHK